MSVDYKHFLDSIAEMYTHLEDVYSGVSPEESKSAINLVMTSIPYFLASDISAALRATLLKQYTEIRGTLRDVELASLGRNDFYEFAALTARREVDLAHKSGVAAVKDFKDLVEYIDTDTQEEINTAIKEQEQFKMQMEDIVRSNTGTFSEDTISIEEVINYMSSMSKTAGKG